MPVRTTLMATLRFSTGGTLGHGFYMMLQMVDQVYLLTGPTGTVVVLEQFQKEVPRGWIELGFH